MNKYPFFLYASHHPKTWIFDLDGTILEYNNLLRGEPDALLPGVKKLWEDIPEDHYIILTTARPTDCEEVTVKFLKENNIRYNAILFGLPRGERILINDEKAEHPGANTAFAKTITRNKGFEEI